MREASINTNTLMQSSCNNQRFSSVSFGSFSVLAEEVPTGKEGKEGKKKERQVKREVKRQVKREVKREESSECKNNQYETNLNFIFSEQFLYPEIDIVCEKILGITKKNPISALLKEFLVKESEEKVQLRIKIHQAKNLMNIIDKYSKSSYLRHELTAEYKENPFREHLNDAYRKHCFDCEDDLIKRWLKVHVPIYEKM